MAKLYETIILSRLIELLDKYNIRDHQHGFRSGMSMITAISNFDHEAVLKINQGKVVACTILNFNEPFDSVDHMLLINKLGSFGLGQCTYS